MLLTDLLDQIKALLTDKALPGQPKALDHLEKYQVEEVFPPNANEKDFWAFD